jgi:hypothetical protein
MHAPFLLRDPDTPNFPYPDEGKKLRWIIRDNRGIDFRGIGFQWKEYIRFRLMITIRWNSWQCARLYI